MPHTVSFTREKLSIKKLNPITFPDFTVLTGVNGSGKSHFLLGLKEGSLASDFASNHATEIILTDWNSIVPSNSVPFVSSKRQETLDNKIASIPAQLAPYKAQLEKLFKTLMLPADEIISSKQLIAIKNNSQSGQSNLSQADFSSRRVKLVQHIDAYIPKIAALVDDNAPLNATADQKTQFEQKMLSILYMTDSEMALLPSLIWQKAEPFQQSFSHIFGTYRDIYAENLRQWGLQYKNSPDAKPLENDAFEKKHNRPPWDVVNEIFQSAKLDFEISKPDLTLINSFTPKLTKKSTGDEVAFTTLSLGEKVIMSFAICLFNGVDGRQNINFPKLLLLDEIDAPLHPSMVRGLLKTIKEVLVDKHGVKVIMTTHNPTTVALVEEECLFEMNLPDIKKVTKDRALNILTDGVPTLAISYEGRRQVFVESQSDYKLFSKLYDRYRTDLKSERSLTFIPVGKSKEKNGQLQEENAGCGQVKKIVKGLTDAGTNSVKGLIDWDLKNVRKGNIHVLCEGIRYSIENLLLDPALLTLALVQQHREFCKNELNFETCESVRQVYDWSDEVWQSNIDKLMVLLLGGELKPSEMTTVDYVNGRSFTVSKSLLRMNGHDLETRVLEVTPFKTNFAEQSLNSNKSLPMNIVEKVLQEDSGFAPQELLDVFNNLLNS